MMKQSFFPQVYQEDGVAETYLKSWEDFHNVVKKLLHQPGYVFRGQRDSNWLLEPSLTRLVQKRSRWKAHEEKYLDTFRQALRGRIEDAILFSLKEPELLAIGQHFGLATPLLDWTTSPYVAMFFAFEQPDGNPQSHYRTVVALHEGFAAGVSDTTESGGIEFIRPTSGFNKRLVHQGGLFTRIPLFVDIQAWVEEHFENVDAAILIKVHIPSGNRLECLRALNRMNINHVSLFPDIDGSSRFCNLKIEIKDYCAAKRAFHPQVASRRPNASVRDSKLPHACLLMSVGSWWHHSSPRPLH